MTIYFRGGEDIDFDPSYGSTITNIDTAGIAYRSSFARCALALTTLNDTTPLPSRRLQAYPFWSNVTTLWSHAQYCNYNNATLYYPNASLMGFQDSTGLARIIVRGDTALGQIRISTVNAAGTVTDLVASSASIPALFASTTPLALDLSVTNYGASGTVTFYVNGVSVATYTGNLVTDSNTGLGGAFWAGLTNGSPEVAWSEMIVSSSSTLGYGLYTMAPVANGNTNTWTGSVSNVNEITINDANYNYTTTVNAEAEYTTSTSLPTGSWSVLEFSTKARIARGATGPQTFEFVVRTINGTPADYTAGSTSPNTSFHGYTYVWSQNPATSAAWAATDFASGFNYGVIATT